MLGGSKVHLGPRSAGNKSLLSYRAGHGITGYGGYCPSSESIPIPIKEGPSGMGAQGINRGRGQPAYTLRDEVQGRESTYLATINKSPTAKQGLRTTQALGPHLGVDEDAPALPNQKFLGDSLYRSSFISPSKHREQAGEIGNFLSSPTRKKPAYLSGSTYSGSYDNAMEMVHGQAWLENKEPKLVQSVYGSLFKEVIVQPSDLSTSYEQHFGSFGCGLSGKTVYFLPVSANSRPFNFGLPDCMHPMDQSLEATSAPLFAGSPKAYRRVPGYQGFMPAGGGGENIMLQSFDHDRADTKNCRLFTLSQFGLNIPGCRSYRPREADNVSKLGKGKSGTTAYFQNLYLSSPENLAKVAKNRAESENFGGCMETKKFFTPGALQQSENGVENSEKFYKLIRPYEGMARIQRPSAVTNNGYKFTCYTDRV